jgi:hypothetical protein
MKRFISSPWLYLLIFWFGGIALSAFGICHQLGYGWGSLYAGLWLMVSAIMVFRGLASDG